MKTKTLEKTTALPGLKSILVERIRLTMTRFVILLFVVASFFASGTSVQAQYSLLPRQCTDAYLEWYCFIMGQITIGQPYVPSMPEKLLFAQAVAAQRLTPAQMEIMWNMPVSWASFQMGWFNLPEWQKEAARRSWRLQIAGGAAYGTQQGFPSGTSNVSPYTVKSESALRRQLQNERDIGNAVNSISTSLFNARMYTAQSIGK